MYIHTYIHDAVRRPYTREEPGRVLYEPVYDRQAAHATYTVQALALGSIFTDSAQ